MQPRGDITLTEDDDQWIATDSETGATGTGPTPETALEDLSGPSDSGSVDADEGFSLDQVKITISPELEALFGIAAILIGGGYLVFGFQAGAILVVVGVLLLIRVGWIEYGLFDRP